VDIAHMWYSLYVDTVNMWI